MSLSETFLVSPLSVPGCQLWLDAADNSKISLSETNVTTWTDKSGNNNNATVPSGGTAPIYSANSLNNKATVSFVGYNNVLKVNNNFDMTTFPSLCYFIVIRPANTQPNTTYAGILSTDTPSQYGRSLGFGSGNWQEEYYNGFTNITAYTANVWTLVSLQFTTTISTVLAVNGVTYNGTATGTKNNTNGLHIGTYNNDSGGYYFFAADFDTAEILAYGANLTTSDRQKIEGYLAWKWGLTANLPSTHPYKNSRPLNGIPLPTSLLVPARPANNIAYTLFRPTNVANCSLWLDAADVSTMFQNTSGTLPVRSTGSTVALWRDKSVSSNHASNTTAQPTVTFAARNGFNVVNFSGSQYLTLSTTTLPTGSTQCTFFFVTRTTSSGVQVFFTYGANPNNTNQNPQFYYATNTLSTDTYGAGGLSDNTNYLNSYVMTSCTFTNSNIAWDNGSQFSGGSTAITLNTGTGWASVGVGRVTSTLQYYLTGQIGEIIVYNRALSTSDRQLVEGYLAWKWGLQTNLPSTHLYRQNPSDLPAVAPVGVAQVKSAVFNPKNITGLQLWLDAADASTLFTDTTATVSALQGNTVARWNDKSGNGNYLNQTTAGNRPRLSSFSNKPAIYFATNGLSLTSINNNATTGNSSRTIFLLQYAPNTTSITRVGTGGHSVVSPPSAFGFDNNTISAVQVLWTPYVYAAADVTRTIQLRTFSLLYAFYDASTSTVGGGYDFGNILTKSTTLNTTANAWYFGLRPDGNGSVDSYVCEFLHYNRSLNTSEIQQIQGYLAWKWGLVGSLPSTHPFKFFPPSP